MHDAAKETGRKRRDTRIEAGMTRTASTMQLHIKMTDDDPLDTNGQCKIRSTKLIRTVISPLVYKHRPSHPVASTGARAMLDELHVSHTPMNYSSFRADSGL